MAISYAFCNLCKNSRGRRVSTSLSNLYIDLMNLPEENRKKDIASLLETKPCAVAKMALFYSNSEFANAFDERFSEETTALNPCLFRESETLASDLPLSEIARLLRLYPKNREMYTKEEISRVGLNLSDEVLEKEFRSYDPETNQGVSLTFLEEDKLSTGLRIIRGYK